MGSSESNGDDPGSSSIIANCSTRGKAVKLSTLAAKAALGTGGSANIWAAAWVRNWGRDTRDRKREAKAHTRYAARASLLLTW